MKRIIVLLALIAVVGSGIYLSQGPHTQTQSPQKPSQEITVYYSQMDVATAMQLGCESSGLGYNCPLMGAGGGHAFKD